jgi:carboxymethylenebutenolidase
MVASGQTLALTAGGRSVSAWYGAPGGNAPGEAASLVILHDWWGFTSHIRSVGERCVAEGFRAIVPDLLDGRIARAPLEGMRNAMDLDLDAAVDVVAHSVYTMGGRVGILGFSLGGGVALLSAARGLACSAVVSVYGLPRDGDHELAALPVPAQLHLADRDVFYAPERVERLVVILGQAARGHEVYHYDAPHGFFHDDQPSTFNPAAAALAWSRAIEFFRRTLLRSRD